MSAVLSAVADRLKDDGFQPLYSPSQLLLPTSGLDRKDYLQQIELSLIKQALVQSGGVVARAARLLNTRRTTLVEKLRKYGLHRKDLLWARGAEQSE